MYRFLGKLAVINANIRCFNQIGKAKHDKNSCQLRLAYFCAQIFQAKKKVTWAFCLSILVLPFNKSVLHMVGCINTCRGSFVDGRLCDYPLLPVLLPTPVCPIGLFDAEMVNCAQFPRSRDAHAYLDRLFVRPIHSLLCRIFPLADGQALEGGEASETNRLFSRREFVVLYDRKSGRSDDRSSFLFRAPRRRAWQR